MRSNLSAAASSSSPDKSAEDEYRIYSSKRSTPDGALIRGISYNQEKRYTTILKQHRQSIFHKYDVL